MNDEVVNTVIKQCHMIMDGVNNLSKNIVEGDEEVGGEENFEQNKEDYNQGNAHGNDDAIYGHGVGGTNSNITRRHQSEW
jgi:hypothetical protein